MPVLVACESGGGGSPAVDWLIALLALAIWLTAAALIVWAAGRDKAERRFLTALLVASFVLGPLIIAAFYAGYFGDDSDLGKLAVLMLIPGALGAAIAHRTRAAHSGKAFLISTLGAVFVVSLAVGLFLVAVLSGDLCLE
jgi:hypothetical protein